MLSLSAAINQADSTKLNHRFFVRWLMNLSELEPTTTCVRKQKSDSEKMAFCLFSFFSGFFFGGRVDEQLKCYSPSRLNDCHFSVLRKRMWWKVAIPIVLGNDSWWKMVLFRWNGLGGKTDNWCPDLTTSTRFVTLPRDSWPRLRCFIVAVSFFFREIVIKFLIALLKSRRDRLQPNPIGCWP